MLKNNKVFWVFSVVCLINLLLCSSLLYANGKYNTRGKAELSDVYEIYYQGGDDGGLAHVTYWAIPGDVLAPEEQAKADKIKLNYIHAIAFHPPLYNPNYVYIAGTEITGLLKVGKRMQRMTFRLPDDWNGKLVVGGAPGLRNEYANEAILVPWLLEAGYAYIAGDKGIPGGSADMLSGKHPTQHWGSMMIDLALWAQKYIEKEFGQKPARTYAMGLSNGGYQTRRALEIDHKSNKKPKHGKKLIFDGGVDWSGAYWPDARVITGKRKGGVSVEAYAAADTMVGSIDKGTLAMGWFHLPNTLAQESEYMKKPRFPGAYFPMVDAGFSPESALYWGYYSSIFDPFHVLGGPYAGFYGVGYYNLVSYVYRAELRGDDATAAAAYHCWGDPANPNTPPPLYDWLANAANGGWSKESVKYALKNANTGEFSAPLISLHGQADGLVATNSMGMAYKDAVQRHGNPDLHRMYIIAHAGHVDLHADGRWGANSAETDPTIPDLLTPMQAYAMRAFQYLEDWVENGEEPPESKLVETDPTKDITDPLDLNW